MGYKTLRQSVAVGMATTENVVAGKKGIAAEPRRLVLVVAHLDSVNGPGGSTAEAPGADDNASGSMGVIEIARALKDHVGEHDLRLCLFGGEEQGLFGSREYVRSLSATERERISAVVNMDMIGSKNTDSPTVLLEGGEVSRGIISALNDSAANYASLGRANVF